MRVQRPTAAPIAAEEAWATAREAIVRASACYRGWREYCVDDADVVDGAIQLVLDKHFDGVMPERAQDLDEVVDLASVAWARYQRKDGLAQVEERIRANYRDPPVEVVPGKGVSVRVGMPPGQLEVVGDSARADAPMALRSPLVERGELQSRELARLLRRFLERYPDQPAVRLLVTVPIRGAQVRRMDVRYYRDLDQVVIADLDAPERGWVSAPIGGSWSPYLEGRASLHTSALERRPLTAAGRPR